MSTARAIQVRVKPQFQRSVRLDVDFDRPDAMAGYIMQPSPRSALLTVARHINETQQRAFTWTGPYGGGKSSLALALALLAGGGSQGRKAAKQALAIQPDDEIGRAFGGRKAWLVLPVVGRREAIEDAISRAIDSQAPAPGRKPMRNGRRDVIAELLKRAESSEYGGVLLILDEMGKLLESTASTGGDIFFYQELAEAASRASGRLVVIGVLHQAFEQYSVRLGREVREEWAKVQGRFVDIPIVSGTDETIELIGGALECSRPHPSSKEVAKKIAKAIRNRRPSSSATLHESLDRCWPLHPVTAALLGPSSRRRFGQNERSVFGFLTSAEPLGFREFIVGQEKGAIPYYSPAHYWDYLRANLEPAILSSPDGHRWAASAEAVERVEARFGEPHVSLVKTVGLIELFRNGSGVAAEENVLALCVEGHGFEKVQEALDDLSRASILIFRKHLQAWGIFSGSDFDIDAAVASARAAIGSAREVGIKVSSVLSPVSARRHYSESGSLRWFEREVVPAEVVQTAKKSDGAVPKFGRFLLMLPSAECPEQKSIRLAENLSMGPSGALTLYGVPKGQLTIMEQASELAALEHVSKTRAELEGDAIARREVDARLRQSRSMLEDALRDAFLRATWYFRGEKYDVDPSEGLSRLASSVCDQVFSSAPRIHSELVNRDSLSSSAAKAQRMLLHRMLSHGDQQNLGYEGYPADAGLYYTVIAELGIHKKQGETAKFVAPASSHGSTGTLTPLWEATKSLIEREGTVVLSQIYDLWRRPPFGIKEGLLPILALGYFLANRNELALYVDGAFLPELLDADVDEWLQDPDRITWKSIQVDAGSKRFMTALSARLNESLQCPIAADPLDIARGLVSLAINLPMWTQRTTHLSERARVVRDLFLRASDPIKVLFVDLPELLKTRDPEQLVSSISGVMGELTDAYSLTLQSIHERMVRAIDGVGDPASLATRARIVQGISGDLQLDAFAGRLQTYEGRLDEVEGLVSLAVSKPPKDFADHDIDHATLQLGKWALEFRRVEALAGLQGRTSTRRAMAVVFNGGNTMSATVDIAEKDNEKIKRLADGLIGHLAGDRISPDIFLAALAEAGVRVLESKQRAEV